MLKNSIAFFPIVDLSLIALNSVIRFFNDTPSTRKNCRMNDLLLIRYIECLGELHLRIT